MTTIYAHVKATFVEVHDSSSVKKWRILIRGTVNLQRCTTWKYHAYLTLCRSCDTYGKHIERKRGAFTEATLFTPLCKVLILKYYR